MSSLSLYIITYVKESYYYFILYGIVLFIKLFITRIYMSRRMENVMMLREFIIWALYLKATVLKLFNTGYNTKLLGLPEIIAVKKPVAIKLH